MDSWSSRAVSPKPGRSGAMTRTRAPAGQDGAVANLAAVYAAPVQKHESRLTFTPVLEVPTDVCSHDLPM